MDKTEIQRVVDDFRRTVCDISDGDVEKVLMLCRRKMEIAGKAEDYLLILLPDELKNHLFRLAVNAASLILMEEGDIRCAANV